MKHPSSRALFAYWDERRGTRPAPERGDIDPVAIRHALGDTFMLAADFVDEHRFRLAGTRVCALFCREIKGESFTALWGETSRKTVEDLLAIMAGEKVGAIAGLTGHTADGSETELEMVLLPLAHSGHARIRAIGALTAINSPYWAGVQPITELTLGAVRHTGLNVEGGGVRRFGSLHAESHVRHGFVVYRGGLSAPTNERAG
jgi:hypothetical protein